MLKTRIITALILLVVLVSVLSLGNYLLFALVAAVFFMAAAWESFRLFGSVRPLLGAAVWTAAFAFLLFSGSQQGGTLLFGVCAAIWILRLAPSLATGLPAREGLPNRLLNAIYGVALLGCFMAIVVLFRHSAVYLLSVMAIVWVADIGAYFAGKAFGRHKLAPSISPGKSWEGAIGGLVAVLVLSGASVLHPAFSDTFSVALQRKWGWAGLVGVMILLTAFSIVGDLFESQLKRRAGMKDSSNLLPGHGGVLDRIDALIPVLPIAVLFDSWL
ncbi:phosphatidate cytidylyltransferase [Noviherbaspirillum humi]|uniref:Phosphatidate cytidylyltransferase n=1 Tax=Noviherbaspirillum humi TaxID=1688639 RepID=A0A239H829_9BURK|nr:phosphatidate cytidylyltransferase [Noviherbaspirillum humi]SNS76973.1 phosphatidate cytidylyltransferase [Noviherbaspirillum humi]